MYLLFVFPDDADQRMISAQIGNEFMDHRSRATAKNKSQRKLGTKVDVREGIFFQKWPLSGTNNVCGLSAKLIPNLAPEVGANKNGADLMHVGAKSFLRRNSKLAPKVGRRH